MTTVNTTAIATDEQPHVSAPPGSSSRTKARQFGVRVLEESGLATIYHASTDVKLLYAQRFVRLFAYGGSTLVLASYLAALGISEKRIGLFMTLTLAGDVVISFFLTLFADAMGRKAILSLGAVLMVASGLVFGSSDNYWILLAAAVFGVISPSGNEIGPFRAVEESTLAHIVPRDKLGDIFAWYTLLGSAGTAFGVIICGWLSTLLQSQKGWEFVATCRVIFYIYAGIGCVKLMLTLMLSKEIEAKRSADVPRNSDESQPLLQDDAIPPETQKKPSIFSMDKATQFLFLQLCLWFALDNFASGLIPLSWITYYFRKKFNLSEGRLGSIFFSTSIISALSTLVAASIAKRIGNVKAMAFTHLPSAICLGLIPIPSTLPLALVFLILRSCSQMMDVAPRTAFLASALPSNKRTAMMGFINIIKTIFQSIGPIITGSLASANMFWVAFVMAGAFKATYDIGMLVTFAGRDDSRPKAQEDTED